MMIPPDVLQGIGASAEGGGTSGGTLEKDQNLKTLLEAWPRLKDAERRMIRQMVETFKSDRSCDIH